MTPLRKIFATLFLAGTLTISGVACGSSAKSSDSAKSSTSVKSSDSAKPSGASASLSAWCKKYEELQNADENTDTKAYDKMADSLVKGTPGAVRDDIQLLTSAFKDMGAVDMTDDVASKAFDEKYGLSKIDAATGRVEVFVKDECGIDPVDS